MALVGRASLMKQMNETAVLAVLRRHGAASRTDVARETGLSLPTVSTVAIRLLELGLLEEREAGPSTGGRRPIMLSLKPDGAHVCGIKLTETAAHGVMIDLAGSIVASVSHRITRSEPDAVVRVAAAVVADLEKQAHRGALGVGLGIAGAVDWSAGIVRHGTYQRWHDIPVRDLLHEAVGIPVVVDNDVNALVTSEQLFGAAQDVDDFSVVTVGRGIGLGLVLDGLPYRGATGGAGELGHIKVADGPACSCGGRGCLEAVVSDGALAAAGSELIGRDLTIQDLTALARSGERSAKDLFVLRGQLLGRAVGNLVNLLNPKTVVLAGEGTSSADLFVPAFKSALAEAVFDSLGEDLSIAVHPWNDQAWARGAACLVLNELFAPNFAARGTPMPLLRADPVG